MKGETVRRLCPKTQERHHLRQPTANTSPKRDIPFVYEIEGEERDRNPRFPSSRVHGTARVDDRPHEPCLRGQQASGLNRMWNRRQTTFFNGASNIAQRGGHAALSGEGYEQSRALVEYYLENARLIREGLKRVGLTVYGGINSPYIWAKTPDGIDSWAFFDQLLDQCHVVVTPGGGFGPAGNRFVRVSAYNHRENVEEAMKMIEERLKI